MERVECAVAGYENFVILFPQPLLVRHHEAYSRGARKAGDEFGPGVSAGSEWFLGVLEMCEFENKPDGDFLDWPIELFNFVIEEIYQNRFREALYPQKKILSGSPITPKAKPE